MNIYTICLSYTICLLLLLFNKKDHSLLFVGDFFFFYWLLLSLLVFGTLQFYSNVSVSSILFILSGIRYACWIRVLSHQFWNLSHYLFKFCLSHILCILSFLNSYERTLPFCSPCLLIPISYLSTLISLYLISVRSVF